MPLPFSTGPFREACLVSDLQVDMPFSFVQLFVHLPGENAHFIHDATLHFLRYTPSISLLKIEQHFSHGKTNVIDHDSSKKFPMENDSRGCEKKSKELIANEYGCVQHVNRELLFSLPQSTGGYRCFSCTSSQS